MSVRDDLKAFVDNELSPARAEEVRLAVEQDPALQQEVQFMKLLSREIQESAAEPEIQGAAEVIEVVRKKPGLLSRYRTFWSVGGLVLVLLLALPYLNPQPKTAVLSEITLGKPFDLTTAAPAPASSNTDQLLARGRASKSATVTEGDGGTWTAGGSVTNPAPKVAYPGANRFLNGDQSGRVANSNNADVSGQDQGVQSLPAPQFMRPQGNRKIIQNGDLAVAVDDVQIAQVKASNLAAANGGFVENSSLDYDSQSQPIAKLTLRIPSPRFAAVAASIQGYGKVTSNHMTGEDVTAQYADVNARLQELGAEEDSYVTMLRGVKTIGQILEIKDRLSQVRQEIQSDHAQAEALKDQSTLSTLNVSFEQKPIAGKSKVPQKDETQDTWAKDTWATALNGLTAAGRFLGQVIIFLFVYSPLWVPIAILVWWLNKRKK